MKAIFNYSIKVWLFTVIPASIIIYGIYFYELTQTLIWNGAYKNLFIKETVLGCFLMIIFSIPLFIIFYLMNNYFQKNTISDRKLKLKINAFGVFLVLFPWGFLTSWNNQSQFGFQFFLFPILLTIGVWIFKIKLIPHQSNDHILDETI